MCHLNGTRCSFVLKDRFIGSKENKGKTYCWIRHHQLHIQTERVLTISLKQATLPGTPCLQSKIQVLEFDISDPPPLPPYLLFQSYLLLVLVFRGTRMACSVFFSTSYLHLLLRTHLLCTPVSSLLLPTSHPVRWPHLWAKCCGIQFVFPGRTGSSQSSRETGTPETTLKLAC